MEAHRPVNLWSSGMNVATSQLPPDIWRVTHQRPRHMLLTTNRDGP